MDIRKVTLKDIEQIKKETLYNFEKNNVEVLNKIAEKIEYAVSKGSNSIDTQCMFHSGYSPEGLQYYLISKGFKVSSSCSGCLISVYW